MGKHQDPEWLYEEYVEKERRPAEIAEECGVHRDTIYYHIDKNNFPKVDHSDYNGWPTDKPYHDEGWLREQYVENRLGTVEIGEECGVSHETIRRWLKKHDIEIRDASEATAAEWEGDDERRENQSKWMRTARADPEIHPNPTSIHPSIFTRDTGHVIASAGGGGGSFSIHRLLAIGKYGPEMVKGKDVHHKNHIPWDNRPENIELLNRSDHMRKHRAGDPEAI